MTDPDAEADAIALEERPTGDFVDGFLAGVATASAAAKGASQRSLFYSFDWIGENVDAREITLHGAFRSDAETMAFEVTAADDWRDAVTRLGEKWFAGADRGVGRAIAQDFVELLEAYFANMTLEAFTVRPTPPPSGATMTPSIGADFDHLLFECAEGRLLLEFAVDG